jgi:hypothetical protein
MLLFYSQTLRCLELVTYNLIFYSLLYLMYSLHVECVPLLLDGLILFVDTQLAVYFII